MSTRIGPRMAEVAAIVSALPGISQRDALRRAGLPLSGPGRNAPIDRAVRAGLVIVVPERRNLYRCFSSEAARRAWHLRAELLTPGTPADRIGEIRAELDAIDRQRAATWTA